MAGEPIKPTEKSAEGPTRSDDHGHADRRREPGYPVTHLADREAARQAVLTRSQRA